MIEKVVNDEKSGEKLFYVNMKELENSIGAESRHLRDVENLSAKLIGLEIVYKSHVEKTSIKVEKNKLVISELETQVLEMNSMVNFSKGLAKQLEKIKKMLLQNGEDVGKFDGSLEIIIEYIYDRLGRLEKKVKTLDSCQETIADLEAQLLRMNNEFLGHKGSMRQ
jgi:hypothetical protein